MYYNGNSFYDLIFSIYYDTEIDLLLVWHSNLAKACVQHHMIVTTYAVWLVSYKSFLPPARDENTVRQILGRSFIQVLFPGGIV